VPSILKTSKPGGLQPCIVIPTDHGVDKLCVFSTLSRTKPMRTSDNLFLGLNAPHRPVCSQTISSWLVSVLEKANVDVSIYKGRSFQNSSTSKAFSMGVKIDSIFQNAGWSDGSKMFAKFYNRPLNNRLEFAQAVLTMNKSH